MRLISRSCEVPEEYISLHHVARFEPITAAHFDQRYNNTLYTQLLVEDRMTYNYFDISFHRPDALADA